jgi:hypothetical protein
MPKFKNLMRIAAASLVICAIGTLPASADPPAGNKTDLCHYQAKVTDFVPVGWYLINVSTKGKAIEKHLTHFSVADDEFDFTIETLEDLNFCLGLGATDLR